VLTQTHRLCWQTSLSWGGVLVPFRLPYQERHLTYSPLLNIEGHPVAQPDAAQLAGSLCSPALELTCPNMGAAHQWGGCAPAAGPAYGPPVFAEQAPAAGPAFPASPPPPPPPPAPAAGAPLALPQLATLPTHAIQQQARRQQTRHGHSAGRRAEWQRGCTRFEMKESSSWCSASAGSIQEA
jgi:hypothetical protein